MEEKALLGIVLFPLLGAIANGLLARTGKPEEASSDRKTVHLVACLSVAASFAAALYCFGKLLMLRYGLGGGEPHEHAALSFQAYEWFSLVINDHQVPVNVRFAMDALSGVMTLV